MLIMIKENEMKIKKIVAISSLLFFGAGGWVLFAAPQSRRIQRRSELRALQGASQPYYQSRLRYRDENGDGIHDGFRDHDNDGIPNCQDPDWVRAQDGTGYQNRIGRRDASRWNGMRSQGQGMRSLSRQSFRWNNRNLSGGACVPRRDGSRRGGRNGRR